MNKFAKVTIALATLSVLVAGCGAAQSSSSTSTNTATASASGASNASQSTTPAAPALKAQELDLTIIPGAHKGPDGKMHDTFIPADFTIVQGVPVNLNIYNYDTGEHSLVSTDLGLNFTAAAAKKDGQPVVSKFQFTPSKAGSFTWLCTVPCDDDAKGWAMSHDGYMMGKINVVPFNNEQYVYLTIKDGLQLGPDGQQHDSYSPASYTVQQGIPVNLTIINYDTGDHSMTSKDLGINFVSKGATADGVPTVNNFTFTPANTGTFHWQCDIPCDGGPTGWAMSHDGYMAGNITVVS